MLPKYDRSNRERKGSNMTDDSNHRAHVDQDATGDGPSDSGQPMTRADWKALATEPDNAADLGYQLSEWEQFEVVDNTDQVIFLPSEESQLEDDAFLVVAADDVVDLPVRC